MRVTPANFALPLSRTAYNCDSRRYGNINLDPDAYKADSPLAIINEEYHKVLTQQTRRISHMFSASANEDYYAEDYSVVELLDFDYVVALVVAVASCIIHQHLRRCNHFVAPTMIVHFSRRARRTS